jgi:hypothetical protein
LKGMYQIPAAGITAARRGRAYLLKAPIPP